MDISYQEVFCGMPLPSEHLADVHSLSRLQQQSDPAEDQSGPCRPQLLPLLSSGAECSPGTRPSALPDLNHLPRLAVLQPLHVSLQHHAFLQAAAEHLKCLQGVGNDKHPELQSHGGKVYP